jgi:hypothetical protein
VGVGTDCCAKGVGAAVVAALGRPRLGLETGDRNGNAAGAVECVARESTGDEGRF